MKKLGFVKRIGAILTACALTLGMSVSAFAAENDTKTETASAVETVASEASEATTRNSTQGIILDFIPSMQSKSDTGYLDHYIGLTKTFECYLTTYGSISGDVTVILYNPKGEIATSFKLNSSTTSYSHTFFLPSSGDWKMSAFNGTNDKVTVTGLWF